TVFRLAEGLATPDPIDFGNVRLDDLITQALTVANAAANDGFSEGLGVSASDTGDATLSGAVAGLIAAGDSDDGLSVGLDTSAAGNRAGTVELTFTSDGEGTSGLAAIESGAQSVEVTGTVFRLADGLATPDPIDFGNVRLDDLISQALTVANAAANDGFSESLGVAATETGDATLSGAVAGLIAAGAEDSSLSVALDTSAAGNRAGTVELTFTSDGEGTSGLAAIESGAQSVDVMGTVFRLAAAGAHSPEPVVIHARVGDTAEQALSITNTATADGFSESLNAILGSATDDATAAGSFDLLGAGETDASSLVVGIDTTASGVKSGTAIISLESDGTGTSGIADNVALPGQTVNVGGNVWAAAVADVQPLLLDFGIVHVGDVVAAQTLAVSNIAVGELTDVLQGGFGSVDGPFSGAGNLGAGVAAGDTDDTSLSVSLSTGSAGIFDGAANLDLVSHNPDLDDLSLDATMIALSGQVNNFANPVFDFLSGDGIFSGGGDSYLLDFGDIVLGSGTMLDSNLAVGNDVPDPADSVDLFFDLSGISLFLLSGFDDIFNLSASSFINDLFVEFDSSAVGLGLFSENILLSPVGFNDSGYREDLSPITLALQVNIIDDGGEPPVPVREPHVLALMALGLLLMLAAAVRRKKRSSG
ncbi:MAG: choice-of-anchor D domain-containing protein, partial [Gammaproteobacteria bacterium]|nr:choice-of-anchor D domain-containing protein [Gammaproteobacteria bacterium]